MAFGTISYGLIITFIGYAVAPSTSWEGAQGSHFYFYMLSDPMELSLKAAILYAISGVVGLKLSQVNNYSKLAWLVYVRELRRFYTIALILIMVVALLTIGVWFQMNPASIYSSSYSIASVWLEYRWDVVFYLFYSTFLIQECLYALGGVWMVQGEQLASLIHTSPFQLQFWMGVSSKTELSENISAMNISARTAWHPYALLVAILYALSQARLTVGWKSVSILSVGLGLSVFIVALSAKVTLKLENAPVQSIGFAAWQSALFASAISILYFTIAYLISSRMLDKRAGGNK